LGDQLEVRITPSGTAANLGAPSTSSCEGDDFRLIYNDGAVVHDGQLCFTVKNTTNQDQEYTVAVWRFENYQLQFLDESASRTVTVAAGATVDICVDFDPCTQYDLVRGGIDNLPSVYLPGTSTPPGRVDFMGDDGTLIPALQAAVTSCDCHCDCDCPPDGHKEKGNEGLGNGADPPPPGHDTNQNDSGNPTPGNPDNKGKKK